MASTSYLYVSLVAVAVAFATLALPKAAAQESLFHIPLPPVLLPWPADNQTRAYQAGSPVAELNLAKVFIGPCMFRMMHIHIYADEVLVVLAGQLESVMVAPNNTAYKHTLRAGDNVVYPKGWMHYQFNANCTQTQSIIAFNAKNIGTVGIPLSLASSEVNYLHAAYNVSRFPQPATMWVRDATCARACRLQQRGGA